MKLVVGLGNPGIKYKNTRHNLGFMVIDSYIKNSGLSWRYSPDWITYYAKRGDLVVMKPSTFMNKSGEAVKAISNFYKVGNREILAIHDDLDLDFGKMRVSFDSSSAGHRGVESVIESLGTVEFARLRIGVGHPLRKALDRKQTDPEKYVLEEFSKEEGKELGKVITKAENAVNSYIESGVLAMMNQFN